ncbi:protein phosphatase 2C domain-containing protein [Phormidium sp. FACHB-1136]|uniref:PP2C family protein-serine/threonine phosphatase n=1 Tax=Phormidium sp. FACHB-1136 TaxID=2692848 RepID=UPI001686A69A|nr:protein phosphatase 2C domain-containing protein [Phormidium sp. FACHB-1136]MBD2427344.1 protein phosphatase 2C domain-containing protein [Phormidium sp. FACHB-1136]
MNRAERFSSRYQPYLWVVGDGVDHLPLDELVGQRYRVVAPRLWLDTQPDQRPDTPDTLPDQALPYLHTHPLRLHVPGLYGALQPGLSAPILLLENAPIHPQAGILFPDLETALAEANPLRQMQWIWQTWELWQRLEAYGLRRSLIQPQNIRVEGWRIRLLELYGDEVALGLTDLAALWQSWLPPLHPSVSEPLAALISEMEAEQVADDTLEQRLNQLLLEQSALRPGRFALAGATAIGPTQPRNEDACWPDGLTLDAQSDGGLQVGIVCDGVGGHEGGDIASQLAIQSLRLQLQTLLAEVEKETQILPPDLVIQQIEAVLRIVNDLICFQNDNQNRVGRQRMGTTLVMAVLVAQRVTTEAGAQRVTEVYLAHIGDSRAYWITPDYCHLLTVDDDIAGREVIAGRQTLSLALERSDAGALTQALGTRSGDYFQPHIRRFLLDETGILLLCSDGLSDHYRIEDAWANYIGLIVKDIVTLESAVASWLELAHQKNGHDNTAVVLIQHRIAAPAEAPTDTSPAATPRISPTEATLYGETQEEETRAPLSPRPKPVPLWVLLISGAILLTAVASWWFTRPIPEPTTPEDPSELPVVPPSESNPEQESEDSPDPNSDAEADPGTTN